MIKNILFFALMTTTACIFCSRHNSTPSDSNPLISIPDTIIPVVISDTDPLPVLIVGNETAASCSAAAFENAVDSLVKNNTGGTIRFSSGGALVTISLLKPLMIRAPDTPMVIDGENLITLSGNSERRIIECANHSHLVLKNIRLINGSADSSGGALLHPWFGALTCKNVTFENNRCLKKGPEFGGGAVFTGGLEQVIFYKCTFINNIGSNGGALLNRGSNLVIDSCEFIGNNAFGDGGGKDAGSSGQGGLGGAVYIDGMNYDSAQIFKLHHSFFSRNKSHCHGSGVFSYYYKNKPGVHGAIIEGCGFFDNIDSGTATTSTGTLYHEGAALRLTATTFAGNTTLKHAGAIFLGQNSPTEIVNSTFYRNMTPGNGGAIFGGTQNIRIVNCTFAENEGSYGPAIFNDKPEAVAIFNTIFVNNVPIVNQYAYRNCTATYTTGTSVFQWPENKANGKPDGLCISTSVIADPLIDTLMFNGGVVKTMSLGKGSPVLDVCDNCPPTDQRGVPRLKKCDAGAFELP